MLAFKQKTCRLGFHDKFSVKIKKLQVLKFLDLAHHSQFFNFEFLIFNCRSKIVACEFLIKLFSLFYSIFSIAHLQVLCKFNGLIV